MGARDEREQEWRDRVDGLSADVLRARWEADLTRLDEDVSIVIVARTMFREIDAAIVERRHDGSGIVAGHFLRPLYLEAQATRIRRLADYDLRSISFRRILREMRLRPEIVTRQSYVARVRDHYPNEAEHLEVANEDFDRLAGAGERQIPDKVLSGYLSDLDRSLNSVNGFVNKYVAHRDDDPPPPISWLDLDAAIDSLAEHVSVISLPLIGTVRFLSVYIQPAWRGVFRDGLDVKPLGGA